MNKKIGLGIGAAVLLAVTGCSLFSKDEAPKNPLLGSNAVAAVGDFPEWTRDGSAFRCKDGKVQGCISGSKCGTVGRTGTDQPVAVCDKCVNWVDLDEFLVENPDFNTNMFLQTLEGYGPNE